MTAGPGRRGDPHPAPVPPLDRGNETLLIGEPGLEPYFSKQRVARGEAIVEGALGGLQPLGDRIDGYGLRPALGDERARRGQEASLIELRASHRCRLSSLD